MHAGEIREAELLPFCDEEKGVGVLQGGILVGSEGDVGAEYAATFIHCGGVVDGNEGTGGEKLADDDRRRSFTDVVRFGFESKTPEGDFSVSEIASETTGKFVEQDRLLPLVDFFHGLEYAHFVAVLLSGVHKGLHVFWEAAAAVAASGVEELVAYASVRADSLADPVEIRADKFAEVCDVVHKRDAGCEHRVGGVLYHLRRGNVRNLNAVVHDDERLVEALHHLCGTFIFHTYHHPVRAHEVLDGRPFLEEFWIVGYIKVYG